MGLIPFLLPFLVGLTLAIERLRPGHGPLIRNEIHAPVESLSSHLP